MTDDEKKKELWREQQREWRKANPDRVKAIKKRYYERHRADVIAKNMRWRKANPEKYREGQRRLQRERWAQYRVKHRMAAVKRRYGMTTEQYQVLAAEQGERCAICKRPFSEIKRLCVDHCHSSQKARGLLCNNCNVGIGAFSDNPVFVAAAVEILLRHQS